MPLDKFPLVVKEFKGLLWSDIDDIPSNASFSDQHQSEVPFDFATACINLEFMKKGGLRTRNGIEEYVQLLGVVGKPIQFWKIENLNNTQYVDRWLILTWDGANGRLYDTGVTVPATNPILAIINMKYAFVLNVFGRMYITPWASHAVPLGGSPVYIYNGAYNARATKLVPPAAGAFAVAVAAGGNCTVGQHFVTVLCETDTGYISIPPTGHVAAPLSATTTAANATINGTNVPVGPTGTTKRHIIITKVVVNNNGQGLLGYEPFFAVTINDNTTTTFSFNKPDSALVDSAKGYLVDNTVLPSCISLATIGNRLAYIAPLPSGSFVQDAILVSPPNRPEQVVTTYTPLGLYFIIETESTVRIGPDFSGKPMCAIENNKVLYVFKEDSTFGVVPDDELDPSEWNEPLIIDGGKGAFPFGICRIGDGPSSVSDGVILVAGNHGLSFFNGVFAQNQIAESIWEAFSIADLKWIKLLNDPIRKLILFRIGDPNLDGPVRPPLSTHKYIYTGNYYYGLDTSKIRWGQFIYPFYSGNQTLVIDIDLRTPGTSGGVGPADKFNTLHPLYTILHRISVGGGNYNIFILSESAQGKEFESTAGTPAYPVWNLITGYTPNQNGEIYTFGPVKLRINVKEAAAVNLSKIALDSTGIELVESRVMSLSPGKFQSFNLNAVGEQIRLVLSGTCRAFIQKLILHAAERAKERPRV